MSQFKWKAAQKEKKQKGTVGPPAKKREACQEQYASESERAMKMKRGSAIVYLIPSSLSVSEAFVAVSAPSRRKHLSSLQQSSPFDEFLENIFGRDEPKEKSNSNNEGINLSSFQEELSKRQQQQQEVADNLEEEATDTDDNNKEEEEFDGYAMRDAILNKWGECFDVDFNKVDAYGLRSVYLNIMPFRLGGKRFRHDTELDYLCHLQAVVSRWW